MNGDSQRPPGSGSGERPAQLPAEPWPAADSRVGATRRSKAPPRDERFPREFHERFSPEEVVAIGGMGELKRYRDTALARDVVVKAIRDDIRESDLARQRFLREARIQANLQHPCIVPVYDIGNLTRPDVYFTMAHIGGVTLRDVIAGLAAREPSLERRFSRRTLLDAFSRVCLAVAYAHERGVIHRDLKPENVMLGEYGEVYVIDWGIARQDERHDRRSSGAALRQEDPDAVLPVVSYEEDDGEVGELTEAGATLGTLEYMAPEQYLSSGSRPDERSDVYSLGAILYEILSLKPFRAGKDRAEVVKIVWRETWKPVERPSPEGLSPELDAVWRRATAMKPRDRFQSARELNDALVGQLDAERDMQRRREEALSHAASAAMEVASLKESPADAEERRRRALKSLGMALAVDPSQSEGLSQLVQSLLEEPGDDEPDVKHAVASEERKHITSSTGTSASFFALWFAFLVLGSFLLGVRSRTAMTLSGALVLALIGYNFWVWRSEKGPRRHMLAMMPLVFLAVGITSSVFGPLVLVPSLATAMFAGFTITLRFEPRARILGMILSTGAVVVPALLEATGLLSPSYVFEDGKITILPRMVDFPVHATPALMLATGIAVVIMGNLLTLQSVTALSASQRSALTQAVRLRHLLPVRASVPPSLRAAPARPAG